MKIRVVMFYTLPLVANSQKKLVLTPPATGKMKIAFLCGNSKNTSYKSCWACKDANLQQKWDHGSIVCYGTCTNHAHLARSPRKLLPGSNSL
jgi:hypothetical protein